MSRQKFTPSTSLVIRLAAIMHRRPDTQWNEKEYEAFRKRYKEGCFKNEQDLLNLERYYKAGWNDDKFYLRTHLITLLNWYQGEVDKANRWCERHPIRSKIVPMPLLQSDQPTILPKTEAEQEAHKRFMLEFALRKQRAG